MTLPYSYSNVPLFSNHFPGINVDILCERISTQIGQTCLPQCVWSYKDYLWYCHHMTLIIFLPQRRGVFVRIHRHPTDAVTQNMVSEMATMHYVQENTDIPVPQVLVYDPDTDRRVGGEWMILEPVSGKRLSEMWPRMTVAQRHIIAGRIADIWSQLLDQRFASIGSLYQDARPRVGPMMSVCPHNQGTLAPHAPLCGPFSSVRAWLVAIASRKLCWNRAFSKDLTQLTNNALSHIRASNVLNGAESRRLSEIALDHSGLSLDNILVDISEPTTIVCVLDWEGARVVPVWAIRPRILFEPGALGDNSEGIDWQTIIRNRIGLRSQVWLEAMDDRGLGADFRMLLARAESTNVPSSS